jgi:hypothetical protein
MSLSSLLTTGPPLFIYWKSLVHLQLEKRVWREATQRRTRALRLGCARGDMIGEMFYENPDFEGYKRHFRI